MAYPITTAPDGSEGLTIAITYATGQVGVMFLYVRRFDKEGNVTWSVEPTPEYIDAIITKTYSTPAHQDRLPVQKWRVLPGEVEKTPYMGAWVDTGEAIEHDMEKAREIHRNRLRRDRVIPLAELDTAYMRADEAGDLAEKRRIAAEKQRLRDITDHPAIEKAATIDDLKAVRIDS